MPTYAQLQTELAWTAEYEPPSVARLRRNLPARLGISASAIGVKGNNAHLYGYHRSRRWVLESRWSQYRGGDYSVTSGPDKGGDSNWLCAIDISAPSAVLLPMCQRLDRAVRAGLLPQVREWYGNVDGDRIVDGYDVLAGRVATSDDSHLWHAHISFFRSRAGDDHRVLEAVLVGDHIWEVPTTKEEDDDMKGIILQDPHSIVLLYIHPTLGIPVYSNIVDGAAVDNWVGAGFGPRLITNRNINDFGRDANAVARELLDAIRAGGGGPIEVKVTPGPMKLTGTVEPASGE